MILDEITASVRSDLERRKSQKPLAEIERALVTQASPKDFVGALGWGGRGGELKIIGEVKRASPSKGLLCADLKAAALASAYKEGGASAVSVLTEPRYFRGSFADLEEVRKAIGLPLLCKDFIVDPYQVYEARSHGADAVLLIVALLSQADLAAFLEVAHLLGMAALIEVHNREELERALRLEPRLLGINNRNLADFSVDLETTLKLRPSIPPGTLVVSESGIHTRDDVLCLQAIGVNAILVGEALVTSPDPAAVISALLGRAAPSRRAPR